MTGNRVLQWVRVLPRAGSTWQHAVRGILRRVVVWGALVQAAGKLPL
jgi:hypothetical protein